MENLLEKLTQAEEILDSLRELIISESKEKRAENPALAIQYTPISKNGKPGGADTGRVSVFSIDCLMGQVDGIVQVHLKTGRHFLTSTPMHILRSRICAILWEESFKDDLICYQLKLNL